MLRFLSKIFKILLVSLVFYRTLCPSVAFAEDLEEERKREVISRLTHQTQIPIDDGDKELKKTRIERFLEAGDRFGRVMEGIYDVNIDRVSRLVLYGFCVPACIYAVSMLVYSLYEIWQQPNIRTCSLHELSQAIAPHHASSTHTLRHRFQTLGVTEDNVTALIGYGFSMIFGNVSEWVRAGGGSFPGTESFSSSLANDEASQQVLVTYGGLANNTCPDTSPLQKAVSGIQKPSSGMSSVCAYETNSVRARLLACGLMQLPSGFQFMLGNCLLNTLDWGDSGANVVAILGFNGAVTVSGRERVLTNTAELTRTIKMPGTRSQTPSLYRSPTLSEEGSLSRSPSDEGTMSKSKLETKTVSEERREKSKTPTLVPSKKRFVYWTTGGSVGSSGIYAAEINVASGLPNGVARTLLSPSNLYAPFGFSVDPENSNLYWVEKGGSIFVSSVNVENPGLLTNVRKLLQREANLSDIFVDSRNKKLYWSETNAEQDYALSVGDMDPTMPSAPVNITTDITDEASVYFFSINVLHSTIYFSSITGGMPHETLTHGPRIYSDTAFVLGNPEVQAINAIITLNCGCVLSGVDFDFNNEQLYWGVDLPPYTIYKDTSTGTVFMSGNNYSLVPNSRFRII